MAFPHKLSLHPDCEPKLVEAVQANVETTQSGFVVEFRLQGDVDRVCLPDASQIAQRRDGLWKSTCFELFWQGEQGDKYCEFNLSPSGCWAAYKFDRPRENMRNASVEGVSISTRFDDQGRFVLRAAIIAELPKPAKLALTAVIELADGALQYWSLAFPAGKPDFHSLDCRVISLGIAQ